MKETTWKALGLIGIGFMIQNYISKKPKKEHPFLKGIGEGIGRSLVGLPPIEEATSKPRDLSSISKVPYNYDNANYRRYR